MIEVLVVDDDFQVAQRLSEALLGAGYAVTCAQAVDEARQMAKAARAVVIDPNALADDLDLAHLLRADGYRGPILVFSAAGPLSRERMMRDAINSGLTLSAWVVKADEPVEVLLGLLSRAVSDAGGDEIARANGKNGVNKLREIRDLIFGPGGPPGAHAT